ncbi:SOS response-associated peptidase [Halomarina oriensis]|uniref:SOS response-associated peptidase n=1 Tax=Halomarina oriensis TaxID=671145 RepID=A0A6B0GIF9_9EURY|nr:SOS response-associated peptidase [Halomarina oriensis]MWG33657.1 SOS response-associated peptidase [Halomarina oriensis]
MCGRYSLFVPPDDLEIRFDADLSFEYRPRYNAAPSQSLPVVRDVSADAITESRWGLLPPWADDESEGIINARAETLAEKPAFRDAYRERRCLVPADGFYEWVEEGGGKQPYRITRTDDEPFALAGLYQEWTPTERQTGLDQFAGGGPEGAPDPVETFTVVTRDPTPFMAQYHHRMALVLDPADEAAWLDGAPVEDVSVHDDDAFRAYPVSTAVNDPTNDSPEVVEELA